ncbi:MAG: EamA family transporter [Hyphomicrobiaceae bacterium]
MTAVLFGLLGASFIGVSDCVARVTTQRVSMSVLFAAVMGLSAAVLTAWMLISADWPAWDLYGWLVSAVSGVLSLFALAFLYHALARGPVTVASPAASSFSVLLVVMNALTGAPFAWHQAVAILLVFLGVLMLSRKGRTDVTYETRHLQITAALGMAAAVAISVRMFLAQEAGDVLGAIPALYLNRIFAIAGVLGLFVFENVSGRSRNWPDGSVVWLVVIQAILETCALASFLIGSQDGGRIGASIGFASFAAVTAVTAWIWLGENIGWRRGFWMSVVAAGIVLAVAGQPS